MSGYIQVVCNDCGAPVKGKNCKPGCPYYTENPILRKRLQSMSEPSSLYVADSQYVPGTFSRIINWQHKISMLMRNSNKHKSWKLKDLVSTFAETNQSAVEEAIWQMIHSGVLELNVKENRDGNLEAFIHVSEWASATPGEKSSS